MKAPEGSRELPRLYTIPPSAPFLTSLAKATLDGDLPKPGGPKPDRLALPHITIYLPTRRAARGLCEAFLEASGGEALLLPRIRALGDPDEDQAIIFGADGASDSGLDASVRAPAIGALERRLTLMRLILVWGRAARGSGIADPTELLPITPAATPAHASYLAADLARLMDFVEREEVDLASLEALVPEAFAEHWQITVEFLKIVTEHWPSYLHERGLVSPVARRNRLMALEAARLAASPASGPVIAAGSTGTVPATARLLQVIASLPNGAVVLPGLDLALDEVSWTRLGSHPEHPQSGMAELLRKLGVTRDAVAYLPGGEPDPNRASRLRLVSEVLRPAGSTEHWQDFLKSASNFENALAGLQYVEAPTAQDEAEAIALILRFTIETEGKTAALVTPDRTLARRVAARLRAFNLAVDDSAGAPVARTVPGAFLDLVLGAAEANFAPPALMALLKHPLALMGRRPGDIRASARALERTAFRDVYVGEGLEGAAKALEAKGDEDKSRRSSVTKTARDDGLQLVEELKAAFAPLTALFADPSSRSVSDLVEAHAATAEALARDKMGASSGLWTGDAGEALSVLLSQLITEENELQIRAQDYPAFYRSLIASEVVRPRGDAHPRLFIWGPLEARLQQPDVVILGSLNEGVRPRPQETGPWLSRPMLQTLKLPAPEELIGRAAHDFAQSLGARTVYLTRAQKVDGVPTVPSRWLQRLKALVDASGHSDRLRPTQPWVAWGRARDRVEGFAPVGPPLPCPPLAARPRHLSVSRIERWIANPYEIFAHEILKLKPLKPLGFEPDPALRGQLVHRMLHEFARRHPEELPANIEAELIAIADDVFAEIGDSVRVRAFWQLQFASFARWFAATEPARRAHVATTNTEIKGSVTIPAGLGFELTARADRIDISEDGSAVLYDYKTGPPPKPKHVEELFAPQLPLEAAILVEGGFAGLGRSDVTSLRYIYASGRLEGGEEHEVAAGSDAKRLAGEALANLKTLIERFNNPDTPYEVRRRSAAALQSAYRYDAYAQLARLQEWATLGEEQES